MASLSLKADIPVPAEKDTQAFASALKVCLAAAAFEVPLEYSTGRATELVLQNRGGDLFF